MVLLKNIANEAKREPLKLARIEEIKESRDGTQRVVVVTYQNVNLNKKGEWIGNPVTVERCVSDVILVHNALNKSMLNPKLKIQNIQMSSNDQKKIQIEKDHEVTTDEAQDLQEIHEENDHRKKGINDEDKSKDVTNAVQNEGVITEDEHKLSILAALKKE